MKRITRRFAAWIACCAILFAALAPSISHAMSASVNDAWAEICSIAGTKYVKVVDDKGGSSDSLKLGAMHMEHCPFCASHGGSFALLPVVAQVIPLLSLQESHPFLFLQSPHPLPAWTTAQSRAPPFKI